MKVEQGRRVVVEGEEREEREKERKIIQLHRLCSRSRSQTICVCKEQKRNKKQGKKRRNVGKERRDEHNGEGNR